MTFPFRTQAVAAFAFTFLLASCGGGGGGGSPGAATPQAVAITESNAKPVAANGLDAAQNTSATSGATGPVGVQVDTGTGGVSTLQAVAEAARRAATSFSAATLPVGVSVSETDPCDLGGTMTISGNISSAAGLSTGDSIALSMNNCSLVVGSTTAVLNGSMTMTVAGGSLSGLPFHIVLAVTLNNMSVASGGTTALASGDTRLDWTANSSTSQTLVATGTSITTRETVSGTSHTLTMRNYSQTLVINGTTMTGSLSASVEADSSRLSSSPVTYTISTPTPVVWNASTHTASAGVIKVVGANNSQILVTIASGGAVTIQIDANGDGTYEKTITSTTAELAGLL